LCSLPYVIVAKFEALEETGTGFCILTIVLLLDANKLILDYHGPDRDEGLAEDGGAAALYHAGTHAIASTLSRVGIPIHRLRDGFLDLCTLHK